MQQMEASRSIKQGSWFLSERGSRLWKDICSIDHTHFFNEVELNIEQPTVLEGSHVRRRICTGLEGSHGIVQTVIGGA